MPSVYGRKYCVCILTKHNFVAKFGRVICPPTGYKHISLISDNITVKLYTVIYIKNYYHMLVTRKVISKCLPTATSLAFPVFISTNISTKHRASVNTTLFSQHLSQQEWGRQIHRSAKLCLQYQKMCFHD